MIKEISIQLNGSPKNIPAQATVTDLLQLLELPFSHIAVAVNHSIVPRSQHAAHQLIAGDQIELIQAVGGG